MSQESPEILVHTEIEAIMVEGIGYEIFIM